MGSTRRLAACSIAAAVALGACAPEQPCAPVPPSAECPDLKLFGVGFNEWRALDARPITEMQELGDATYPACNVAEGCPGSEFDGSEATDVWVIPGVDAADAVIGMRQNADTLMIFVRAGVEPDTLIPLR